MPLATKNRVAVQVRGQNFYTLVGDLEPGTIFKLFPSAPNGDESLGYSSTGRIFVKAGNGKGPNDQLLKDRYNGDQAPLAIVVPTGPGDNRAWTPCTHRITEDTPVMAVLGILNVEIF